MTARNAIVQSFASAPEQTFTVRDFVETLGISVANVRRILRDLVRRGALKVINEDDKIEGYEYKAARRLVV